MTKNEDLEITEANWPVVSGLVSFATWGSCGE